MEAQAKQAVPEADPEQFHPGIQLVAGLGPVVFNAALFIWFWGQWSVLFVLAGVWAVLAFVNVQLVEWVTPRRGRAMAETVRMLANLVGGVVGGTATHWHPLAWVFVPYSLLLFSGMVTRLPGLLGSGLVMFTTSARSPLERLPAWST